MTRQFYDDDDEGVTEGRTVYETDDQHPRLLGPDGEPLRLARRMKIGFDTRPREQRVQDGRKRK